MAEDEYPYVAGVDTSTQSCKVVIVDPATGTVVRQGRAAHPGGTEVDPEAWWSAFLTAVGQAGGLADVHALAVGGQQHGMVCLDAAGRVIRPALLWNDTRSGGAARDLIAEHDDAGGTAWWVDATGSAPVASLTVTKLRWLAEHERDNAARIAAVALPHDWLSWRISGSTDIRDLWTDRSEASGTGYLAREGNKDPRRPEYRRDILASALYIRQSDAEKIILPRVAEPWEICSHGDPARGWAHVALGPGAGDNAASALGMNLTPGEAMLSLGTSGVVAAVSAHSVMDPTGAVTGFADASGNWLPMATTLNASRITDAMRNILGVSYEEYSNLALSVPDAGGLTLLPYFEGERTPNLPDATASMSGMTLSNSDPAHVARAGVEGLLTLMAGALAAVERVTGPIDRVSLLGGGAKLEAVRRLAPNMLHHRVEIAPDGEYVALGAARQAERAWQARA
ncbi:FGGY family carbohydrate kinase [Neoactinobaculum massilliense]|uniref:FGGY family carbohydrate kinase n=1 Tax=Neoactinobaculum massilliense TaxID=2364794 RepID=UPI000F51FF2E|nr:FGGY family carbohydrate kinase [Neoactinobaculum massilliense]